MPAAVLSCAWGCPRQSVIPPCFIGNMARPPSYKLSKEWESMRTLGAPPFSAARSDWRQVLRLSLVCRCVHATWLALWPNVLSVTSSKILTLGCPLLRSQIQSSNSFQQALCTQTFALDLGQQGKKSGLEVAGYVASPRMSSTC